MTIEKNDWRLQFGKDPSFYVQFAWELRKWKGTRPHWDHDHCEFCLCKIADIKDFKTQNEGWADDKEMYWICKSCFEDFKDMYQWRVR